MRLGGTETVKVDVRILAATNADLKKLVQQNRFREDLYYRINVITINLPRLRERKEDIPLLVGHFLKKYCQENGRPAMQFTPQAMMRLLDHDWPGNVRELENAVRRLVVLGDVRQVLTDSPTPSESTVVPSAQRPVSEDAAMGLREIARRAAREAERRAIAGVLDQVRWNRTEAARLLKISYKTLLSKIAECGLAPKQGRRAP